MNKQIIFIITIFLLALSCKETKTDYQVKIILQNDENINKLYLLKEIGYVLDSVKLEKGLSTFSGHLDEPQLCLLYSDKYPNESITFILDFGKTKIYSDSSSLLEANISYEHRMNNHLRKQFQDQFIEYEQKNLFPILPDLRKARSEKNQDMVNYYERITDSLAKDQREKIFDFVKSNSDYPGTAEVIYEELVPRVYLKPEEFLEVYKLYSEKVKSSYYGVKLKEFIDKSFDPPIKIGEQIIDFEMDDINGKNISISDFRNKYVLIDFWASWCAPCRAESPNLRKAYNKYKPMGFEIVSISLDTDRKAWLQAIEKDSLTWTNLSDLKGWKNELALNYQIVGIPLNILLNQKGVIIAKDLHGTELITELKKVFE